MSQALWAEQTLPLKRLWSRALTRRICDVRFRGVDPRVCRNVARRNDAVRSVHVPLMGVCWVLLCMHRVCCAMEKCAANAALGSAREPDGGFDWFSSARGGSESGAQGWSYRTDKREKVGAHF